MRKSRSQPHVFWHFSFFVLLSIFSIGCSNSFNSTSTSQSVVISEGAWSNIDEQRLAVIRDNAAFDALWSEHSPGSPGLDGIPPKPDVDFNIDQLLALFLGERNTGGYSINIESVVELDTQVTINVLEQVPGAGCVVTTALTQPYQFIIMSKIDKPVIFQIQSATFICS